MGSAISAKRLARERKENAGSVSVDLVGRGFGGAEVERGPGSFVDQGTCEDLENATPNSQRPVSQVEQEGTLVRERKIESSREGFESSSTEMPCAAPSGDGTVEAAEDSDVPQLESVMPQPKLALLDLSPRHPVRVIEPEKIDGSEKDTEKGCFLLETKGAEVPDSSDRKRREQASGSSADQQDPGNSWVSDIDMYPRTSTSLVLSEEELERRIEDARQRRDMLDLNDDRPPAKRESSFPAGDLSALPAPLSRRTASVSISADVSRRQKSTASFSQLPNRRSSLSIDQQLASVSQAGEHEHLDGLDKQTVLELTQQLAELSHQVTEIQSLTSEAGNRQSVVEDEMEMVRKRVAEEEEVRMRERDGAVRDAQEEFARRRRYLEEATRKMQRVIALSEGLGAERASGELALLEDAQQEARRTVDAKVDAAEGEVAEWQADMEEQLEEIGGRLAEAVAEVAALTRRRDEVSRRRLLVQRALRARERRDVERERLLADAEELRREEERKQELYVAGLELFDADKEAEERRRREREEDALKALFRQQLAVRGCPDRQSLRESLQSVTDGGAWPTSSSDSVPLAMTQRLQSPNTSVHDDSTSQRPRADLMESPGPKTTVGVKKKWLSGVCGEAEGGEAEEEEEEEKAVRVVFWNSEEGHGYDAMGEKVLCAEEEVAAMVGDEEDVQRLARKAEGYDPIDRSHFQRRFEQGKTEDGDVEGEEEMTSEERKRILAQVRQQWKVDLPWRAPPSLHEKTLTDGESGHQESVSENISAVERSLADVLKSSSSWMSAVFHAHPLRECDPMHLPHLSKAALQTAAGGRLARLEALLRLQGSRCEFLAGAAGPLLRQAEEALAGSSSDVLTLVDCARAAELAHTLFQTALHAAVRYRPEAVQGKVRALRARTAARAELQKWYGEDVVRMTEHGTPVVPGAVGPEERNVEEEAKFSKFSSARTLTRKITELVFSVMAMGYADSELIGHRSLLANGVHLSLADAAQLRQAWEAEKRVDAVVTGYQAGSVQREEYTTLHKETQGWYEAAEAWYYINGRWHYKAQALQGYAWQLHNFLQLSEGDFDFERRTRLYQLGAKRAAVDGFGRNLRRVELARIEDIARDRQAAALPAPPPNLPSGHGGAVVSTVRSSWVSATASPWKSSSAARPACDAPQAPYDALEDTQKGIASIPSGGHLQTLDQPRASWNSAAFAVGTAEGEWAAGALQQGRGRADAWTDRERRREAHRAVTSALGGEVAGAGESGDEVQQTAVGAGGGVVFLRAMGIDDEVCNEIRELLSGETAAAESRHDEEGEGGSLSQSDANPVDVVKEAQGQGGGGGGRNQTKTLPAEEAALHVGSGGGLLHLGHNGFGDAGVAAIAVGLWRCWSLEPPSALSSIATLDLSGNAFGDAGAAALFDLLGVYPPLTALSLADNRVTGDSVCALAASLGANTALLRLDLSRNLLSGPSLAGLCAVLGWSPLLLKQFPAPEDKAVNVTLRELLLDGNALGPDGARWLGMAAGCWSLKRLSVCDCGLGDEGFANLVGGLQTRMHAEPMAEVRVGDNSLTPAVAQKLVQHIGVRASASNDPDTANPPAVVLEVLCLRGQDGDQHATITASDLSNQGIRVGKVV